MLGPNITGNLNPYDGAGGTGAFTSNGTGQGVSNVWTTVTKAKFDASLSNPIYGSSDTIQNPSGYSLMIIKE